MVVMKETSWQAIHNLSTLVRNTTKLWEARPPKAIRESLHSKAVKAQNSSYIPSLDYEMSLVQGSAGSLKFCRLCIPSNSPFPDQCSVLCVCCTWFVQTSAVSHSTNLMGNTRFISNLQGEVLRHRRRRKLEEALTLTSKAERKIISQLLTHFSRQGHHNSHIPLYQGLISGQQHTQTHILQIKGYCKKRQKND